jgi:hypothetical protein
MYEVMVNTFHSQIQNRDTQITHLQQTINEDKHLKSKLEKKLVQKGLLKKESGGQRHGQSHCHSWLSWPLLLMKTALEWPHEVQIEVRQLQGTGRPPVAAQAG